MTLIDMSLLLVLVGLGLWLVTTYVPLAGGIKRLLNVVLFVVTLIWVLQALWLISSSPVRIPPLS